MSHKIFINKLHSNLPFQKSCPRFRDNPDFVASIHHLSQSLLYLGNHRMFFPSCEFAPTFAASVAEAHLFCIKLNIITLKWNENKPAALNYPWDFLIAWAPTCSGCVCTEEHRGHHEKENMLLKTLGGGKKNKKYIHTYIYIPFKSFVPHNQWCYDML